MDNFVEEGVEFKKKRTAAMIEEDRCIDEMRKLLAHPGNRYFLWRLLSECRIFQTISNADPTHMAILSGGRDKGLWVLDWIMRADPKALTLIQQEAVDREKGI